jgi:hypothetical protein
MHEVHEAEGFEASRERRIEREYETRQLTPQLLKCYACERDVAQCQGLKGWEAVRVPRVAVRAFGVAQTQAVAVPSYNSPEW